MVAGGGCSPKSASPAMSARDPVNACARNCSVSAGSRSAGRKRSASPAEIASAAPSRAPVNAACVPSSPGALDSRYSPPTSGASPIAVSGIPTCDVSVTIRMLQWPEMPTPPPSVMPSMYATIGLPKWASSEFIRYSSAQNVGGATASPRIPS